MPIRSDYLWGELQEIKKIDDFRAMLRGIKNLMLETAERELNLYGEGTRDLDLHTLLGATANSYGLKVWGYTPRRKSQCLRNQGSLRLPEQCVSQHQYRYNSIELSPYNSLRTLCP